MDTLDEEKSSRYLDAVRQFGDVVLTEGRDHWGPSSTPLFVDGIAVDTREPVTWQVSGEHWILSNLGSQQILFRTLQGLSRLSGQSTYQEACQAAWDYAFCHLRHGHLLSLGGHMAFDLGSKRTVYAPDKGPVHELKCHYPDYEFMWSVSATHTTEYIDAMWEGHVKDWDRLEFSRHGLPVEPSLGHGVWDRPYGHLPVFFTAQGLTFINAGSDLIYAGAMLTALSGDEAPLVWAERLAQRYVEARHPATGLAGYQFSRSVLPGPRGRGDRAEAQFGAQLAPYQPTEATVVVARQIRTILGRAAINKLLLAERLGLSGEGLAQIAVEDLLAYARYAYDSEDNRFHPIMTNGMRLTGLRLDRDGYYGRQGMVLTPMTADFLMLWAYCLAYQFSPQPQLWAVARQMAKANGLGDIGPTAEDLSGPMLAAGIEVSDPLAIFCLLTLYATTNQQAFLDQAQAVGDNILNHRWHRGLFLPSRHHRWAKFDALEPLALIHLVAYMQRCPQQVPKYWASSAFFGSLYADLGHKIDNSWWYDQVGKARDRVGD